MAINTEKEIKRLQARIRQLTAPPTLEIVKHTEVTDPYPDATQLTFEWQGYRHRSMLSNHISDIGYREHVFRTGVEACVRAHAEAQLSSLVITEETFTEHYKRVRG